MKETDLTDRMRLMLERAYQARERAKCSREDFADGYVAALIDLRSKSSFSDGRWMPDGALPWEHQGDQANDKRDGAAS